MNRIKNGFLWNTSSTQKFVIFNGHASAPIGKERLSPTNKARREASRNKVMKDNGMPDRDKSFKEVDNRKDLRRARFGFVKPIQNGLRKKKNLM